MNLEKDMKCMGSNRIFIYLVLTCQYNFERTIYLYKQIIYSYRIEQAMSTKMLENINLKTMIIIYKKIFYAVDIHRNAMKLVYMK